MPNPTRKTAMKTNLTISVVMITIAKEIKTTIMPKN